MLAQGYMFAVATALGSAVSLVTGKQVVNQMPPLQYVCLIMLVAALFSAGFEKPRWPRLARDKAFFFLFHCFAAGLAIWTMWLGIAELKPAVASFLARTEGVCAVFLACVFLGERLNGMFLLGTAFALLGVFILEAPTEMGGDHQAYYYMLMGAALFGVSDVAAKRVAGFLSGFQFAFWRNSLLGGTFALTLWVREVEWGPIPWGVLIVSALTGPCLARAFYIKSLERLPISRAAVITQLEPLFVVLLSYLFLEEALSPSEGVGGSLLILGCLCVILGQTGRRKPPVVALQR